MKKIVYVIIGLIAFVSMVNLSAVSKDDSTIKLSNNGEILDINPLY